MMRPTLLTAAVWLALAGHAHAATPADASAASPADAKEFDRIQVTATRTERAVVDVPNTVSVIDRLFEGAGSSAIADFNPMQRYWRDGHTARLHTGSDYDMSMQHHGRSLLGLMPTPDL